MAKTELYSLDVEKNLLAGMLKFGNDVFDDVRLYLKPEHFWDASPEHKIIYTILSKQLELGKSIDEVLIADNIRNLGARFDSGIDMLDYLRDLKHRKTNKNAAIESARSIMTYYMRRSVCVMADEIKHDMLRSTDEMGSYEGIVGAADRRYNDTMSTFEYGEGDEAINIYDVMQDIIEGRTEEDDNSPRGPHPKLYKAFGSIVTPGNITVVAARSGVGKTQFAMDFSTEVTFETGCPVIHFDNGEMSLEELVIRQMAALSGVPEHLIKSGKWRHAGDEIVKQVRDVYAVVKDLKFYYVPVGGLDHKEMIAKFRREYFSKVGRGNYCVFSFDYIKTSAEKSHKRENEIVGDMMDAFKTLISTELVFDRKPAVGMITSVQSNRIGIVGNKASSEINEDSSSVSLSDRIEQISTHLFILRVLSIDERAETEDKWGTHVLIPLKRRHLGEDVKRALELVKIEGKAPMYNRFFLKFDNFKVEEMGDLVDFAESIDANNNIQQTGGDDLPL